MVQDKTITTHKCELCGRWYDDHWQAEQCEDGCKEELPDWTTEYPREPGWYWHRSHRGGREIIEVGKSCAWKFGSDYQHQPKDFNEWWSEKIVPPQQEENNV